jgi:hypothetical protein
MSSPTEAAPTIEAHSDRQVIDLDGPLDADDLAELSDAEAEALLLAELERPV